MPELPVVNLDVFLANESEVAADIGPQTYDEDERIELAEEFADYLLAEFVRLDKLDTFNILVLFLHKQAASQHHHGQGAGPGRHRHRHLHVRDP